MMRKTKVIKVNLVEVRTISPKALAVKAYDGSGGVIPRSTYFGEAFSMKGGAHWIAEWILKQKGIQHSTKKVGWYDPDTESISLPGKKDHFEKVHIPTYLAPIENPQAHDSLIRQPEEGH
jgi:hypothetical protein